MVCPGAGRSVEPAGRADVTGFGLLAVAMLAMEGGAGEASTTSRWLELGAAVALAAVMESSEPLADAAGFEPSAESFVALAADSAGEAVAPLGLPLWTTANMPMPRRSPAVAPMPITSGTRERRVSVGGEPSETRAGRGACVDALVVVATVPVGARGITCVGMSGGNDEGLARPGGAADRRAV